MRPLDVSVVPSLPLSLNDPATFVANAQANGFTPEQAAALYHQRRLFGGWRWVNEAAWPQESLGPTLRFVDRVNAVLDQVRTPAEWQAYGQHEVFEYLDKLPPDMVECFLRLRAVDEELVDGRFVAMGTLLHRQAPEWSTTSPWPFVMNRQPWTWELVERTTRDACFDLLEEAPPLPSDWDRGHIERWLAALCREAGLAALSLPWMRSSPMDLWRVGHMLRRRARSLRRVMGWTGPLLGLAGKLDLHVGSSVLMGGVAIGNRVPNPVSVYLGPAPELVFEHEWGHALDNVLWEVQQPHVRSTVQRGYHSEESPAFKAGLGDLYKNRRSVRASRADQRNYPLLMEASIRNSDAYRWASPSDQEALLAILRSAAQGERSVEAMMTAFSALLPAYFQRYFMWIPWVLVCRQDVREGQSFPVQVYDVFCLTQGEPWNPMTLDLAEWWRDLAENWARCIEVSAGSSDGVLADPLLLPAWRPHVRRLLRTMLHEVAPHWDTLRHAWQQREEAWQANQSAGAPEAWPLAATWPT